MNSLPDDILCLVLENLNASDLCKVALVNKEWRRLTAIDSVWNSVGIRMWGSEWRCGQDARRRYISKSKDEALIRRLGFSDHSLLENYWDWFKDPFDWVGWFGGEEVTEEELGEYSWFHSIHFP
mmetsp:Transcript_41270/g.66941  ORF Transcript_41270/g.66941 Transcript_41270/m.66941 type:complete len:124 (+) Transcript_41270:134-505(+)